MADTHRWWIVFSIHEEWYAPLVKLGIGCYQRSMPIFTHCFLVHALLDQEVLEWYEVEYGTGPVISDVNYLKLNYTDGILTMRFDRGEIITLELDAIDVTMYVRSNRIPVFLNAQLAATISEPLNICTLARHVVPFMKPIAWTCSGYVARILDLLDAPVAFFNPPTPDELYRIAHRIRF